VVIIASHHSFIRVFFAFLYNGDYLLSFQQSRGLIPGIWVVRFSWISINEICLRPSPSDPIRRSIFGSNTSMSST